MLAWKNKQQEVGMIKKAVSMLLGLLASLAMATAAAECSGVFCSNVKIKALYVTSDGDTYVEVYGNMPALDCTLASSAYITLLKSSDNYKDCTHC
jgi:hypothetical protein